jgi:hypothetical protein
MLTAAPAGNRPQTILPEKPRRSGVPHGHRQAIAPFLASCFSQREGLAIGFAGCMAKSVGRFSDDRTMAVVPSRGLDVCVPASQWPTSWPLRGGRQTG